MSQKEMLKYGLLAVGAYLLYMNRDKVKTYLASLGNKQQMISDTSTTYLRDIPVGDESMIAPDGRVTMFAGR